MLDLCEGMDPPINCGPCSKCDPLTGTCVMNSLANYETCRDLSIPDSVNNYCLDGTCVSNRNKIV